MKIIEILPHPSNNPNAVKNFLSDDGRAFTTYDNGSKPIEHNGQKLYEKKLSEGGLGYKQIKVRKRGYMIHRLVAENFVPNPDHKPVVNHKNLKRDDNRAENLEWVTYSENSYHAASNGKSYQYQKKWCKACNRPPTATWCIEEFNDRQVRWRKHRDVVRL